MEVSLTDDKVEDVMRRIQNGEDMYVTVQGRVMKRSEKLKSCGVTDGCTIQVMSKLRGGGRNKSKMTGERKKKSPKKAEQNDQNTKEKNLSLAASLIICGHYLVWRRVYAGHQTWSNLSSSLLKAVVAPNSHDRLLFFCFLFHTGSLHRCAELTSLNALVS